jgi:hypothetical protein
MTPTIWYGSPFSLIVWPITEVRPPYLRHQSELLRIATRGPPGRNLLGRSVSRDGEDIAFERSHVGEHMIAALPFRVVARRGRVRGKADEGSILPDFNQPVRIAELQRTEKDGIDHAKDRGVCSNPEC